MYAVGEVFHWIWIVLVAVIIVNVILRYVFSRGMIELEELQWYLYAVGWLVGLSYTFISDDHVRVDVLHEKLSYRGKLWFELGGLLLLFLPFVLFVVIYAVPFVELSWVTKRALDLGERLARAMAGEGLPAVQLRPSRGSRGLRDCSGWWLQSCTARPRLRRAAPGDRVIQMEFEAGHYMAMAMFLSFIALIFAGYPVAWLMGGLAMIFTLISVLSDAYLDTFFGVDWGIHLDPRDPDLRGHEQLGSRGAADVRLHGHHARSIRHRRGPDERSDQALRPGSGRARDHRPSSSASCWRPRRGIIGAAVVLLAILGVPLMLKHHYDPRLGLRRGLCDGLARHPDSPRASCS